MKPLKCPAIVVSLVLAGCGGSDSETAAEASIKPVARPTLDEILKRYNNDTSDYQFSDQTFGVVLQAKHQSLSYLSETAIRPLAVQDDTLICESGSLNKNTVRDSENDIEQTTYRYENCRLGGYEYSGQKTFTTHRWLDSDNSVQRDYSQVYQDYSVTDLHDSDNSHILHGSVDYTNAYACDSRVNVNLVKLTSSPLPSTVISYQADSDECRHERPIYTLQGEIYISDLGKVSLKSTEGVSLQYGFIHDGILTLESPPLNVLVTGNASDEVGLSLVDVDVDFNSDSVYDREWQLPYRYLVSRETLDLSDDDNDGMWATWEQEHGLDPNSNDKDEDLDNDGYNNYLEFLLGSDPSRANQSLAIDIHFGQEEEYQFLDYAYQYTEKSIDLSFSSSIPKQVAELLTSVDITIPLLWTDGIFNLIPSCQVQEEDAPVAPLKSIVCSGVDMSTIYRDPVSIGSMDTHLAEPSDIILMAIIDAEPFSTSKMNFYAIDVKPTDFDLWLTTPPSLGVVGGDTLQTLHISYSAKKWYQADYNKLSPEKVKVSGNYQPMHVQKLPASNMPRILIARTPVTVSNA